MSEQRWYSRRNCNYPVQIISPVEMPAQVVDLSNGGISLCLKQLDDHSPLKPGQPIQMVVTTEDTGFLSNRQKVNGQIVRLQYDKKECQWFMAVEVVGGWEDLP